MISDERIDHLVQAVARGEITSDEARKLVTDTIYQARQIVDNDNLARATALANQESLGPGSTDINLAVSGLARTEGIPRDRALELIANQGLGKYAELIASEREKEQAAMKAEAERIYADSPEGRREAAAAAAERQGREAKDGRLARAWLIEQQLVTAEDADAMSHAEAISFAFGTTAEKEPTYEETIAYIEAQDEGAA